MIDIAGQITAALAGRYDIERELGAGGMATVYLATDVRHQRQVAVKVLHPDLSSMLGAERFLKEIQLTAGLQHPHILPLFDSGEAGGLVYYVMPFISGETLRARLEREHQLPIADAVRIAQDVAGALDYAHKRGIIHRDIKPENILLHDGRALVADFGIALAVEEARGPRMTQTGLAMGTPTYMAPEQAAGERVVDGRVDVFALGCVTYEMLSGEPPFSGPTMQAIVAKVLTSQPVPLQKVRNMVPDHVAAAVDQALQKLPADRQSTAEQFAQGLKEPGHTSGAVRSTGAGTRPSPLRTALPWVGGVLAGAIATYAALPMVGGGDPSPLNADSTSMVRFVITAPDSLELQAVCCGQLMSLTPDGRQLIVQARTLVRDSSQALPPYRLYRRDLRAVDFVLLPGTDSARSLSVSPDGTQIAFTSGTRLRRQAIAGGVTTDVATLPTGFVGGTTWIGNDKLAVNVGTTLYEYALSDGQRRTLLPADSADRQPTGVSWVAGHGLLFSYASLEYAAVVHWLPNGTTSPKRLMQGTTPRYVPAWKALLVNRLGTVLAYPFDPATGDTLGPGVRIADRNGLRSPILAHAEYAVADNGTLAFMRRTDGLITGWNPTGTIELQRDGNTRLLVFPANDLVYNSARFARDNRRFVVSGRGIDQSSTLFVYDVARDLAQRISGTEDATLVDWNATDDSVVYTIGRTGNVAIRAADGSGTFRALPPITNWRRIDAITVRDPWLVISGPPRNAMATADIAFVKRDEGGIPTPFAATNADETEPALSPDGKWLAYSSNETGTFEVYVSPFPDATSRTLVTSGGGRLPVWNGSGRTLSFTDLNGTFLAADFTPGRIPVVGKPRVIERRGFVRYFTVSPDGTNTLVISTTRLLQLQGVELVLNQRPPF